MTKCVVYLHGWKGSPDSKTGKAIHAAFPKCHHVAPILQHGDADRIQAALDPWIASLVDTYGKRNVLIVGNSAGGFWANHYARKHRVMLVLINPSLDPVANLAKYGLTDDQLAAYNIKPPRSNAAEDHVFIGEDDDVVDNSDIGLFFNNITYLRDEGHRLADMTPVINIIKEMLDEEI